MKGQLTIQILDILHTCQEVCLELFEAVKNGDSEKFKQCSTSITTGMESVLTIVQGKDTVGNKRLLPVVQSILDSSQRIINLYSLDRSCCLKKIEFELLPVLQEGYLLYYVFQFLNDYPEKQGDYYRRDKNLLCGNSYIDEAIERGYYKYDVSIYVLAYNKLEYTKQCVESLLNNIPKSLNYELILVNHGSTDGTKEYFESVHPNKQLDIAVNGGGVQALGRIIEGEFTIHISNDVIITPYAIENMLACIRSDPQIACVVPTTSNVSNLQAVNAHYENWTELQSFALQNNQQSPFRWEQRVRYCNPLDIYRTSVIHATKGLCPSGWYHTTNLKYYDSFPDDRYSLLLRRNGYKLMLAKDAYCHHFGSVTLKDEIAQQNEQKYYLEGRREFYKAFGVDPWGTGFCYDSIFLDRVVGEHSGHTEVLGINCGLGSNSLKIKEQIKEFCHNTDCTLTNLTDDPRFLADLKGISDTAALVSSIKDWKKHIKDRAYEYIVWETPFLTGYKFKTLLDSAIAALAPGGQLLLKRNEQSKNAVRQGRELGNDWFILSRRDRQ